MNKWQKEINRIPKFMIKNKDLYKYFNFRTSRINIRRNINRCHWNFKEFQEINTNYIKRKIRVIEAINKDIAEGRIR